MPCDKQIGNIKSAQKISNSYGGLSSYYTLSAKDTLGYHVGSVGDLDGDGVAEVTARSGTGGQYIMFLQGCAAPTPAPTRAH